MDTRFEARLVETMRCNRLLAVASLSLWLAVPLVAAAAEQFKLALPTPQSAVENVELHFAVSGTAEFALEKGQALAHPISAQATLKYRERALPGAGRDAQALRALRHYDSIDAKIRVADHETTPQLADDRRLLVAEGRREGILFYSPQGPLTALQLELLRAPGDSLSLLGLLPPKPVTVGEKWSPPSWVGQMLTDTEAAAKSDLSCTLEAVDDGQAKVKFEGTVEGATAGSSTKISLHGSYVFDVKAQRLAQAEFEQTEERSVGPISPGLKVTAKAVVLRTPASDTSDLTPEAAAAIPLEPPAALLQLYFRTPWNVKFRHDRDWHVFQQSEQIAVLRLMDQGAFVAQCNLAPVRQANPGEHVPDDQFQKDIRTSLGTRLKAIEKAEILLTDDQRFLYRVTANGEANKIPTTWIYYLCAAPNGLQTSFVFAVETALRDKLGKRDLEMINSLRFLDQSKPPTLAVPPGKG
jgi:hypothetical protein